MVTSIDLYMRFVHFPPAGNLFASLLLLLFAARRLLLSLLLLFVELRGENKTH